MEVREHRGKGLAYLAVEPDGYDPAIGYPVVILLHGFGASMGDLAGLCPAIDREGYVYVCPNGPIPVQIGFGMVGYAWTPSIENDTREDADRAEQLLALLLEEVMARYRVEPGNVILGGFSQGGMMTYRCGLTDPANYRGLVVLSSRVPDPGHLRPKLPRSRSQPIFITHGTSDSMIPIAHGRESRRFLEAEGYEPDYKEYSMGHEINQDVLDDLVRWIPGVLSPVRLKREPR